MSELSDMIKNWNTDILKDEDRVYDSKNDINRLIKVIPLLGEGIIQMKTSTRNLMINGLPLDGKLYKGTGSDTSGIVEVVPEGTGYVYHMAKSDTTQGAWSIKSTDTTSISQIPYVSEDVMFTNILIKGSGTATLQFLDKDGNVLSEMTTPALTDTYQAFNVKGQLKDSVWSFKIVASDAIYFKQVMITRSSFPSDYMLSEEELEQLNIINTSNIDANTVTKSHAYQVIGLKNCPANVSTSGLFITIQKDNFAQVFVPNDDTGIYYRVGVTTNRPNTKWTRLATSDNTYSKEDFTEMRTSDNINLIQDSSMSAGFWAFTKDGASTSVGSLDTADGIAHITGNGTSGTSWAQYQVTNQDYQQPLFQNSEIQYEQDYTVSVETTWSEGADIASNGEVPPSLIVREEYKDGSSKDIVHVKAVDKYGYNKWHKLSETFKFSENRKNDISFIQVILMWKGAKGDVYFRRPKLEMASLPSAYTEDTVASVEPNHNLLQDSRDLLNGWQKYGSKVSLDATGDMAWYQGMRVQHQFGDWSSYGTTKIPVLENGKYYTVTAYMRGLNEADINMYATILVNKSNNDNLLFPLAKHLTGEWRRYSYTFKFDANTQLVNTSAIWVGGQGNWDSIGGSAYVAGIKLEEGKTATDWSPSIEETIVRYETQNWQKDKITADNGDLALRINSSGTDPMDKQFLSATGTKTFYLQGGATGNNTGDSLRGILIKDSPSFGNAYAISNENELWFLSIQDSKLTPWSKVAKEADVMAIKDEEIDFRHSDMLKKTFDTMRKRGDFYDNEFASRGVNVKWFGAKGDGNTDDSTAIQNAIQLARDNFSNHTGSNVVIIPQGTYFLQSTIELPPYVKLTSTGLVKLVSGVTDGALIHIKYDDDDTATIANEYTRGEYTRGALINGASGGFNLINKSDTKTGIGILIGDNTDRSSSLSVSRFHLTDLTINGFSIAIKHNVYNVYLGIYDRLHLEQNTTNVQFGDANHVDVVNGGENMAFNNCVFAGAENSFVWYCGGFDCNFNNCSMDFNANVFDLKRGWKSINYLGGHIEGCPKVFYYETTNASDVYFKQSSAPTFNFYGTIMFCNSAEDSYLFETKNDVTKAHLLLSNPRFIITKPGLNNYYLANKNVDVNCQGITTQSEYLIPIAENINPVPAWSYQDTAKFTIKSNDGVEGSFITNGIPGNKFGTVFSGLGKGNVSVNPWATLTTQRFTVANKSKIFSKMLYFCEGTFNYAEIKYKFYDYSNALIYESSQGVNFIEAGADKWIQGSILQSVPGGAVSCEIVITVSKIDSGKRAYVGPIMCSAI